MFASGRTKPELRAALDACDGRKLKAIISELPSCLPQSKDPLVIANCLEHVRVAADVIIEACDYNTAFESAVSTRSALLSAKYVPWAVAVLNNFAFEERVVSRVALTLSHLAGDAESRGLVGASGAVDQLAIAWKSHPSCIPIIQALISLTAGHIDNISRLMRRRGITTAVNILKGPETARNTPLVEQTLILIGLCTICTPDNYREGISLGPAIIDAINSANALDRVHVAKHAFRAIANIAECWTKENAGYDLGDLHLLVERIITWWLSCPNSRDMAFAASWALAALCRHNKGVLEDIRRSGHVAPALEKWRLNLRTVDSLANLLQNKNPDPPICTKSRSSSKRAKAMRNIDDVRGSNSDTAKSESEVESDRSDLEGRINDPERSPVSVDLASVESNTIIIDSDSDDDHSPPLENTAEFVLHLEPTRIQSSSREFPATLDADSDDQTRALIRKRPRTRSKKENHTSVDCQTIKRKRAASTGKEKVHHEDIAENHEDEMIGEESVRRSKRRRKPNSKYVSSPRQRPHPLSKTKQGAPPLVSFPFIVPQNGNCEVVGRHQR